MSDYCNLKVLTHDLKPPKDLFCGEDVTYISTELGQDLMFKVVISELSLGDIIGSLRAAERKFYLRVYIDSAKYHGIRIENKWLHELDMLPYVRPWQDFAMYLGKMTWPEVIMDYNYRRGKDGKVDHR